MKKEDAKVGDFVRLKKGGAEMQVVGTDEEGYVACCWLVGNQSRTWPYPPEQLDFVRKGSETDRFWLEDD